MSKAQAWQRGFDAGWDARAGERYTENPYSRRRGTHHCTVKTDITTEDLGQPCRCGEVAGVSLWSPGGDTETGLAWVEVHEPDSREVVYHPTRQEIEDLCSRYDLDTAAILALLPVDPSTHGLLIQADKHRRQRSTTESVVIKNRAGDVIAHTDVRTPGHQDN